MANESGYANFSALIPNIYQAAYLTAREQNVVARLATTWTGSGLMPRVFGTYSGGTAQTLTETTDGAAQQYAGTSSGTVTPSIIYANYFLTDTMLASDPNTMAVDAGRDLGNIIGQKLDTDLCGLFASFTGSVGTVSAALSWSNVMYAAMKLRASLAPMPYVAVLNPMHWYGLGTVGSTSVPFPMTSPAWLDELASSPMFVGNFGGIAFFLDANVTQANGGAIFSPQAIAMDVRRALRIEQQRDASRGGGGVELNASMIYGKTIYRNDFGYRLLGTVA
jgi:hypothetical protein